MSQNNLSLIEKINEKRAQVQINALTYDMEWITHKIQTGDIVIDPEYQRLFQWTETQESRFIESLILNLPIPPIYLVEEEDGKRILLDGLQRICTYLHFIGEMPNGFEALKEKLSMIRNAPDEESFYEDDNDEDVCESEETRGEQDLSVEPLRLIGCDIIDSLNGKNFTDLELGIQRKLKQKPIDIYSYTSSNTWIQYQMFTRMNAGGSPLSPQQIRNAKIRIINKDFINVINQIVKEKYFLSLAKRFFGKAVIKNRKMELQEIVLKIFAFANYDENYQKNIGEFLDEYLEKVSKKEIPFDVNKQTSCFENTCKLLNSHLSGNKILRIKGKAYAGLFEAIFISIFSYIDSIKPSTIEQLQQKIDNLNNDNIVPFKGGGKNTKYYHDFRKKVAKELLNL